MGDFEECLEVNVKEEWGSFKGQHCLADIHVSLSGNGIEVRKFAVLTVAVTGKLSLDLQFTHISSTKYI
jgi:hypothetical protein